jgi:hypothetical protein
MIRYILLVGSAELNRNSGRGLGSLGGKLPFASK